MLCTRACYILVVTIIIMKKHKCKNMNVEFSKGARIKERDQRRYSLRNLTPRFASGLL